MSDREYKKFAGQSVNNAGYHNHNWDLFHNGNELRDVAFSSLAAAIKAIGTASKTLYITTQHRITSKTIIPSNISIKVLNGGSFNRSVGATLTINGPYSGFLGQHFTGAGTTDFSTNYYLDHVWSQWWGAIGDDSTACATAINAALTAFHTVKLAKGRYRIGSQLNLRNGSTLFGSSKTKCTLVAPSLGAGAALTMVDATDVSDWKVYSIGFDGGSTNYPDDTTTIPKIVTGINAALTFPVITAIKASLSTSLGTEINGINTGVEDCHFENITNFSIRYTAPSGTDSWRGIRLINNTFYKGSYQEQVVSISGLNTASDRYARDVVFSGNISRRNSVSKYLKPGFLGLNSSTDCFVFVKCQNLTVVGNTARLTAGTGIRIEASINGTVTGNSTFDTGQGGIEFYNGCADMLCSGNSVRKWGKIPNFGSLREYAAGSGSFYFARETPGPYNSGSPTVTFPADPSASSWFELNPYNLQGVATTTIPDYSTSGYYDEAVAYSGDPTASPPTGFATNNAQGVLANRGCGGITVSQQSERITITGNSIVGDLTQTGGKYDYASDYGIMTVHNANDPTAYNSPIILGPNTITGCIKAKVYQPSFCDPINRKGVISGVRLFPLQFTVKTNSNELTELMPSLQENILHSETIPSLTFASGGYLKIHGSSRPAIGTGAFGLFMLVRFTSALDTTARHLFDAGVGGAATIGFNVLVRDNQIGFSIKDGTSNHFISYSTVTDWGAGDNKVLALYVCRESSGGVTRMIVNGHEVYGVDATVAVGNLDTGNAMGIGAASNGTSDNIPFELFKCVLWGQSFTRDEFFTRLYEKRMIRNGDTVKLDLDLCPYGQFFQDKASFWADRYAVPKIIYSTAGNITASNSRHEAFASDVTATNGSVWLTGTDQKCLPDNFLITHLIAYSTGTPTISVGSTAAGTDILVATALVASTVTVFVIDKVSATAKLSLTSTTTDSVKWSFVGKRTTM